HPPGGSLACPGPDADSAGAGAGAALFALATRAKTCSLANRVVERADQQLLPVHDSDVRPLYPAGQSFRGPGTQLAPFPVADLPDRVRVRPARSDLAPRRDRPWLSLPDGIAALRRDRRL